MKFVNGKTYNISHLFLKSIWNKNSLHEEIHAKYSLSWTPITLNGKMFYKKPYRFFPEFYRSVSIYLPFLLFFEETVNKKSFTILFSEKFNIIKESLYMTDLKPCEVSVVDKSRIVRKLFDEKRAHSQFVDKLSTSGNLQGRESDTLNPASVPLKYYYTPDSQNNIVDFTERHQRIEPTIGNKVHGIGTREITSFPFLSLPQPWRVIATTQEPSTTPVVYVQSPTLKEIAFNSSDNVLTSGRTVLDQIWQTRMLTIATTLATIPEGQVGTPTVDTPQSVHLTGDTQPALREWAALIIKQPLLEAARGITAHSHADGMANETHPFTVIYRVDRMELPQLPYAYAQPTRLIPQDEHTIIKVHEKEIVKTVQKEVQSLMSSGSIVKYLSRTDYAQIANNVYSSLTRQLIVERERLGIR